MNVYLIFNIELNLFLIETVKKKEILIKIKNELLYLKNKVENTFNHVVHKDKLYYF